MRIAAIRAYPIGAIALCVSSGVAHATFTSPSYRFGSQNSLLAYVALALLHVVVAGIVGIPDESDDVQPALARALAASALATAGWLLIQTISPGLLPRQVILVSGPLQAMWSFLCANVVIRDDRARQQRERVVAVIPASEIEEFRSDCSLQFPLPELPFQLVEVVAIDHLGATPAAVHGQLADHEPSLVVLADSATAVPRLVDAVTLLHRSGVKVRTVANFYEEYLGKESLAELNRMTMLFDVRTVHHTTYRRMKRTIDIVGGLVGLVVTAILVPFVLVGNLIGNRGPLLFRQPRVGKGGEVFQIYKFRSMAAGSKGSKGSTGSDQHDNQSWTSPDDPRITPFGQLLRRSHLDELPQSWNILRRELSLVGPRPEQPHYVEELIAKEPAFELRQLVTPGLTGWAQIKHRYAATEAAAIEKLRFDLYYLRNQSLALDLRIMSRTVRSVVRRQGH
jgi:lipopolysaccharide/colanic/teichoic acid biosynthesis glycosyltransferase